MCLAEKHHRNVSAIKAFSYFIVAIKQFIALIKRIAICICIFWPAMTSGEWKCGLRIGGCTLKRKCNFDEIFVTGCAGSCQMKTFVATNDANFTLNGNILKNMKSSNCNIFRVTGPLWGESTGRRWIPLTKASDAELWCFLWSAP